MTPAEELVAAADKLEALITEATPGPWRSRVWENSRTGELTTELRGDPREGNHRTPAGHGWTEVARGTADESGEGPWLTEADAAYIAAMNPLNGGDLAVLLRVSAEALLARLPDEQGEIMADKPGYIPHPLVSIARRINGGAS